MLHPKMIWLGRKDGVRTPTIITGTFVIPYLLEHQGGVGEKKFLQGRIPHLQQAQGFHLWPQLVVKYRALKSHYSDYCLTTFSTFIPRLDSSSILVCTPSRSPGASSQCCIPFESSASQLSGGIIKALISYSSSL